ncbi:MAG: class I SAM-dependent methyltransferase [Rhodospirillales bacterium]|nr:class I SAM-dependent methyltransferase [Rhodospirillales bacterium]
MSYRTIKLTARLYRYLQDASLREPDVLRRLREETASMPMGGMQICPEQGQFMGLLVRLMGAKTAIEVGTFTGYSALSVALALPDDGALFACDRSDEWTRVARRYWAEAGVADKIELRLGKGVDSLDALIAEGRTGTFDFAFIDADKKNYQGYYEKTLTLLRAGGLVAIDNVLWDGRVADPGNDEDSTRAIRDFNAMVHEDARVDVSLIPIGDGLTLALKRG